MNIAEIIVKVQLNYLKYNKVLLNNKRIRLLIYLYHKQLKCKQIEKQVEDINHNYKN
jgi:hypothetical protein